MVEEAVLSDRLAHRVRVATHGRGGCPRHRDRHWSRSCKAKSAGTNVLRTHPGDSKHAGESPATCLPRLQMTQGCDNNGQESRGDRVPLVFQKPADLRLSPTSI